MTDSPARPVTAAAQASRPTPIRVMIVDDSAFIRGVLRNWIAAEPDMRVVAAMGDGRAAVEEIARADPDVVLLDVDMPELDGISALPLLLARRPGVAVIMVSALTRRHADVSIQALMHGAADYIAKPNASDSASAAAAFRGSLVGKVRELARAGRPAIRGGPQAGRTLAEDMLPPPAAPARPRSTGIRLRPLPLFPPQALLIGASTGGPPLLAGMFRQIGAVIDRAPVLVVQHMPSPFTAVLAEHLSRASARPVREALHGEPIKPGCVYLAPGGRHLRVERRGAAVVAVVDDGPPLHHCKPAVDLLFESAAAVFGPGALAVVLTGMGADGTRGAARIVAAGGGVIAQDEASSVVWGMPGAVARAGLCSELLAADELAPRLRTLFGRAGP